MKEQKTQNLNVKYLLLYLQYVTVYNIGLSLPQGQNDHQRRDESEELAGSNGVLLQRYFLPVSDYPLRIIKLKP